jgi:hypothetical protein
MINANWTGIHARWVSAQGTLLAIAIVFSFFLKNVFAPGLCNFFFGDLRAAKERWSLLRLCGHRTHGLF